MMDKIDLTELTNEELINLIRKKDQIIEEKDSEIEELQDSIKDLYNDVFVERKNLEDIDTSDPESVDLSALVITTDEEDNSKEVYDAEKIFDTNKDRIDSTNKEIFEYRKDKISSAISNYLMLQTKNVSLYLGDVVEIANIDVGNYDYGNKELSRLVGKTSNYELVNVLNTQQCLSIFSIAYERNKNNSNKDEFEKINNSVVYFINHFLSDKIKFRNMNYEEKSELLNKSYFRNSDLVPLIKIKKEKDILNKSIENNNENNLKCKNRL